MMFREPEDWSRWLAKNHATSTGIWLQLAKKASGIPSVSYSEALEAALCYGWIDGQKKGADETTWLQRFVPRKDNSLWSKINREDRKSTRLNSSHANISYAVFCLKK